MTDIVQLTSSDIAQMADVGLSTVSNWRARHDDFPEPVSGSGTSPRFDAAEVRAWLKARGKNIRDVSADRVLWNLMDRWRFLAHVDDTARLVSGLLVWRAVSDPASPTFVVDLPETAQWPTLAQQTDPTQVIPMLQASVREYEEKSEDAYRLAFEDLLDLIAQLSRASARMLQDTLLYTLQTINGFESDQLASIYLAFQDRTTQSLGRGYAEHSTSPALIDVMVAVSKDIPGPVHDPAVGSGRLLFAVGRDRTQLTGQDVHPAAYSQALQRALITRRDNVRLALGDVFQRDYFEAGSAQVVVVDPPFGVNDPVAHQYLALDHRLPYGTPPKSRLDTAWLQLAVWYLGAGGRAFVLQPGGTAFRGGAEATIRANMLKSGTIEAVVSLPVGTAGRASLPLDLWVLARPGESADPEKVLLIDHSEHEQLELESIATLLRTWRTQGVAPADEHAGVFAVSDLLEKDSVLTPKRWIAYQDDTVSLESVTADMEDLHTAVQALDAADNIESVELVAGHLPPKLISIAELVEAGSVEVLRSKLRGRLSDLDEAEQGTPVIDGQWIRGETSEPQKIDLESLPGEPLITKPGDVLLQNTGGLAARVDQEGGQLLLSPSFYVLRLQDDRLLPEYLAEMLVSAANRRQAMGAGIQRIRLEDLDVALLSQTDQQRLVTHFKTIRHLQAAAHHLLGAASTARDALVDGVTSGSIQMK